MLPLIITRVRDQARAVRSFDLMPESARASWRYLYSRTGRRVVSSGEAPAYFAFASAPEDAELEVLVKQKVGASNLIFDMNLVNGSS